MNRISNQKIAALSAVLSLALCGVAQAEKVRPMAKQDFTQKGAKAPDKLPENALGTTGAFGWIWHDSGYNCDTQVYVTRITPKTAADGVLQKGDVILGAAAGAKPKMFEKDARDELGWALVDAESEANQGRLALKVWRQGKTMDVQLTIPVAKGAFDKNAPATCERAQHLVNELAATIEKRGLKEGKWEDCFDALGLLATGEKKYHPMLQKYAQSLAITEPLDLNHRGKSGWSWGYTTLFLSEYYGATKDKSVLPDLTEYATKLAMGQSYAGTWNHTMANPDLSENFGNLNGRLGGYGAINQTSLSCAISLVVARKVGVDNKEIKDAVQRSSEHFKFFVDKGSIPYGDDSPSNGHSTNGKNAMAAVFLDLIGEKEGSRYFSRMLTASYNRIEGGHTGHFFKQYWGAPGVACTGDLALNAYVKEIQPYLQFERQPGAVCEYQPMMNAQAGRYPQWSMNGARLLQYCAPRKQLYITGKDRVTEACTAEEVAEAIALGRRDVYEGRTTQELLQLLGSWSSQVRRDAAIALGEVDDNVVSQLIAMLDSENRYARYGACYGLMYAGRGSEQAVDALIEKGLKSDDVTMRFFAGRAFSTPRVWVREGDFKGWKYPPNGLGDVAMKGANELLRMAVRKDPVNDPRNKIQSMLASRLFYRGKASKFLGLLSDKKDLSKVDRQLLLDAARSILHNQNGRARQMVAETVYPALTQQERELLRDDIVQAVKVMAPSGIGGGWAVRWEGLELLAKDEDPAVPGLTAYILEHCGKGSVVPMLLKPLKSYGPAAKEALPVLQDMIKEHQALIEKYSKEIKGDDKKSNNYRGRVADEEKRIKALQDVIDSIQQDS